MHKQHYKTFLQILMICLITFSTENTFTWGYYCQWVTVKKHQTPEFLSLHNPFLDHVDLICSSELKMNHIQVYAKHNIYCNNDIWTLFQMHKKNNGYEYECPSFQTLTNSHDIFSFLIINEWITFGEKRLKNKRKEKRKPYSDIAIKIEFEMLLEAIRHIASSKRFNHFEKD